MKNRTLIQVLLSKAMAFAIPGVGLGLLVPSSSHPRGAAHRGFAVTDPDYTFFVIALALASTIGLVMPLIANTVPIRRALSRTLRDSLDVYHHVLSDVSVKVIRLANLGIHLWQTCLALLVIVLASLCSTSFRTPSPSKRSPSSWAF